MSHVSILVQHIRLWHRLLQIIWQAAGSSLLLLRAELTPSETLPEEAAAGVMAVSAVVAAAAASSCGAWAYSSAVSGCRVDEWIPYACRHSLTVRAFSMKFDMDWSETTTWADAMAFCWSSRQMCSSWTDSMPGI